MKNAAASLLADRGSTDTTPHPVCWISRVVPFDERFRPALSRWHTIPDGMSQIACRPQTASVIKRSHQRPPLLVASGVGVFGNQPCTTYAVADDARVPHLPVMVRAEASQTDRNIVYRLFSSARTPLHHDPPSSSIYIAARILGGCGPHVWTRSSWMSVPRRESRLFTFATCCSLCDSYIDSPFFKARIPKAKISFDTFPKRDLRASRYLSHKWRVFSHPS